MFQTLADLAEREREHGQHLISYKRVKQTKKVKAAHGDAEPHKCYQLLLNSLILQSLSSQKLNMMLNSFTGFLLKINLVVLSSLRQRRERIIQSPVSDPSLVGLQNKLTSLFHIFCVIGKLHGYFEVLLIC